MIIDGKHIAANLRASLALAVSDLQSKTRKKPGLAVILVGEDPASQVYVRNKAKQTHEVGMESREIRLPASTSQDTLLAEVQALNADGTVHGILVQLPLPDHIDENAVIESILPEKDVDGFHVVNTGKLVTAQPGMVPCTPLGCLMMLKQQLGDLSENMPWLLVAPILWVSR